MRFGGHVIGLAAAVSAVCGLGHGRAQAASRSVEHAYGACLSKGQNAIIDDMEDGDARISGSEGRLGVWYTFNPGGGCQQTPVVTKNDRFVMTPDSSQKGKYVAATQGHNCQANGWSGGGIGFHFLAEDPGLGLDPIDCGNGYDASAFKGLSFALKSQGNVRVQVCTLDVTDYNCHGYDITAKADTWRDITIPWSQLLQEDWGPTTKVVPFNSARILSVQFKAMTPKFSLAVNDVKFLQADTGGSTGPGVWHAYKPQDIYRDQLKTEYENWKAKYFVDCGDGSADIRKSGSEAVSEGTGYGMLMAVSMDDRQTFDRLTQGFQKRRNPRGMMSWQFSVCGGVWGDNAATDGDLDIAMALVMADRIWGGYRFLAEPLITALKQYGTSECEGRLVLRPGDMWGGCRDNVDQRLNPSYFAPGYYRVFASYLPNQADFWNDLTRGTYELLALYQRNMGGLFPDWSYANGATAGAYGYEACRVPWRIGTDFAWHGKAEASQVLKNLYNYAHARGGPAKSVDQKNSCFIGGLALTATARDQNTADQWYRDWISSIPQAPDPQVGDNPYYQGTLRVLYLLLAGGLLQP
ncbi:MAG: CIA30 family protein [Pseudobdellovibrionaceae bacterium]|nr:CIA30 family protein [Pseudobdellovibrionaceae bacterium]